MKEVHCYECWWSVIADEQKNLYWCYHPIIVNYMAETHGKVGMLDGAFSCGKGTKEKPSCIPDGWGVKK